MQLLFCDLCHESVPLPDLESGAALRRGGRVVCRRCNDSMSPAAPPEAGGEAAPAPDPAIAERAERARRESRRRRRRAALAAVSPSLAAALGGTAIGFALLATVVLFGRIEQLAGEERRRDAAQERELQEIREREHDIESYLAKRVAEEASELALASEDERRAAELELERLRAELDELLLAFAPAQDSAQPREDPAARLAELERQVLFLQRRLHELVERGAPVPVDDAGPGGEAAPPVAGDAMAVEAWLADLRSEDPARRVAALFGLGGRTDPTLASHVMPLLQDPEPAVRAAAARLLEELEARPAVPALIEALADEEPAVRSAAAGALRAIAGRSFLFDPLGPEDIRRDALREWRGWWEENWREFLYGE